MGRGILAALFLFFAVGAADSATSRPLLVVGGDHANPPYEFIENGKPTGFSVELMQAVAEVMGFRTEFRLGPWAEARKALEQGRIDALTGMLYSADRNRLVEFSVPHTLVTSGIFVRTDSPIRSYADIHNKEIIVQDGDIMHDVLLRSGLASRIVAVTDVPRVLQVLASGKHDCAVTPSRLQGEYFMRSYGLSNVRAIDTELPQLRYCFALRKGDQERLSMLNEGLNILKAEGRYREIYEKWFGVYERQAVWDTVKSYVFLVLGVVACLVALGFAWSFSLRKQVRLRTAELRESENLFRVLAETTPAAIVLYQEDRFIYVNPAAMQASGYTEQEFSEKKFWDLASDEFKALIRTRGMARQAGEQMPARYEYKWLTKGGQEKWAYLSAARIEYNGKPAGIATLVDISDRKHMEEELREARAELEKRVEERTDELAKTAEALRVSEAEKSLILNITDAIVLYYDPDMNILWANKAAGESVDLPPEELRRRRCWEVWQQREEPCADCPVLRARDTGQRQEGELHTSDGRIWFMRAYPVKDATGRLLGMVQFTQDFTERKQMEEALRQATLVVENSPAVLFRWKSEEGWPVELVSSNIKQFGYSSEDFLSGAVSYASIIHSDDLQRVTRQVGEFCTGGAAQFCLEYRILTRAGEVRWVNEHANVERSLLGQVVNYEGIVIDISERKRAEEELERQKSRLVELNDTLENRVREEVAKNREKDILLIQQNRQAAMGELLEHVAHQWKQPLTVISLIVQNLYFKSANGELTDDAIRETVDTTTDLLNHMAQTIEDFRDFYRPDKEQTVFRISDSVDNALTLILPALKHEAIAVDVEVDPDLLAVGHPREYIQVLLNVLSNARDALTHSAVEHPRIRLRGYAEDGRAVVSITDNAEGIPEAIVSNIFDLYVTTKEARGGTGIGLHMSKNIIEKNMQGSLSARNTEQGAQFVIAVNMPKADSLKPLSSAAR